MRQDGHLGYLSKEGMQHLSLKLLKYLDYAVSIRPGSEVIYRATNGFIHGDTLDKLLERPELFADVPKPLYLAIETGAFSVVFDSPDHQPETIHRLIQKAQAMSAQVSALTPGNDSSSAPATGAPAAANNHGEYGQRHRADHAAGHNH